MRDTVRCMGARSRAILSCCALVFATNTWTGATAAQRASVGAATRQQKPKAQELFAAGIKQFEAKDYASALESFRGSYGRVASPNSQLMIARSLRELDRLVEAFLAYQSVIKEAEATGGRRKKYEKASDAARTELDELRPRIAFVTMQVKGATPDTKLLVGEREIAPEQWGEQIPVRGGAIVIAASAPGKPDVRTEVEATGGNTTVHLDLAATWAPAPPAPAPARARAPAAPSKPVRAEASASTSGPTPRHWAYAAGSVGVAGLVTFGVFGVMSKERYGDLEDSCPNNQCSSDRSSDIDSGKTYQTVANVGLAVGVAGLGVGVALYLLSEDPSSSRREMAMTRAPRVDVGLGGLSVNGRF
ncbi:MAG: hypothetical protein MUF54_25365 [Polyangiaceae bacterium]|nr:hypothetical protein [Polyangiaceae bacterium]